ncbi:MAG: ATP-binding cassette domain-containing protein [Candidatus Aminicenantes bacterium]|jgi:osmoprotectant transport system ATP-binding protein
MIEVSNLTKEFNGLKAVDNISFSVKKGETFVLLGTSGCGKTTTLKMINRLIEPTSGEMRIEGENTLEQEPTELRKRIGYVIQDIGLFPHYTVEQNVSVVPRLLDWDRDRIRNRTNELLKLVGLSPPDDFVKRFPEELSGGQQQRVGLARAFAADPSIVLLDEPFGALDPITRRQIQQEFKKLEVMLAKTMILVTHDIFEAFDLGDRICLMDAGRIQQIGTPKNLIFSPEKEFVQDFFRANRFLLELKVIPLKDLLPEIPDTDIREDDLPEFDESASLLDVLETMETSADPRSAFRILNSVKKTIKVTTHKDILEAFLTTRLKIIS